jgi:sialic acid synthase SpsE
MSKINFIAELCQNHNGDFDNIARMTKLCANNGADIIKLQYIKSSSLSFRPKFEAGFKKNKKTYIIKRKFLDEYIRLKKLEISDSQLLKFVKLCKKLKVEPCITCFTRGDINRIRSLGFKTIKIASYDCSSFQLLREVKNKFTNIIVSTGATFDDEIDKTSKILKNKNYSFLHCVTIYPTPLNELHLKRINYLKKYTNKVGYSDHSLGYGPKRNLASLLAIYHGAKMIERHIRILDKKDTKDGKVSIEPKDIFLIKKFSLLSKKKQKDYLHKHFKYNFNKVIGSKTRELSNVELLNRDYYRGRFVTKKNSREIFNWEEIEYD